MEIRSYSLLEITTALRRIVAANMSQAVWIKAEVAQISVKSGHRYLLLIEKDPEAGQLILAQLNAVVWAGDFNKMLLAKGSEVETVLKSGQEVLLNGYISFHERYGMQFRIEDLDLNFTRGMLDQQFQLLVERIYAENLHLPNKQIPLPPAFRKIAVISSRTAAGLRDFEHELDQFALGGGISRVLFDTIMQGEQLKSSMLQSLEKIYASADLFDAIVIIRGGGSKIDLANFNDYDICKMLSASPLPLLTGIGHEIDQTAPDLIAAVMLKTPTAVAGYLISHNNELLQTVRDIYMRIRQHAGELVRPYRQELKTTEHQINRQVSAKILQMKHWVHTQIQLLLSVSALQVQRHRTELFRLRAGIEGADMQSILDKGYTLVMQDERRVNTLAQLDSRRPFRIRFIDGTIEVSALK